MTTIGYARVSTRDQDLSAQLAELQAAGAQRVFKEKQSGAKGDRAELAKAIRALGAGDVLVVTRLDRLARSTRDLLNIVDAIAKRGAGFKALKDTWADTTTSHGRLMLTILGGLAEFERSLIVERTAKVASALRPVALSLADREHWTSTSVVRPPSVYKQATAKPMWRACSPSIRQPSLGWRHRGSNWSHPPSFDKS